MVEILPAFLPQLGLFGPFWAFLTPYGAFLVRFGRFYPCFDRCWGLGGGARKPFLVLLCADLAILDLLWPALGPFWGLLGSFWLFLAIFVPFLGPCPDHLCGVLRHFFWPVLGHFT